MHVSYVFHVRNASVCCNIITEHKASFSFLCQCLQAALRQRFGPSISSPSVPTNLVALGRTAQNLRLRKNAHNSDYFKNTCISRLYYQIDRLVQASSKNMQEKFELDRDLNVGQLNHFEQRSRSKDF